MADTAAVNQLVDHFFRHESGKLVSLLTRMFGLHHLDLVEDVVQSAMLQALETWKLQGVPRDPSGWMYRVARNKALDLVRRQNVADRLASEFVRYQAGSIDRQHAFDHLCLDREMQDSQLRMMFACCHPDLPAESQIALTLKTLCGLSTLEIARALLTTESNIKKRLARAKRKFAAQEIRFEVPSGGALKTRLASVYAVLYLLFNEGYNTSHPSALIILDATLGELHLRAGRPEMARAHFRAAMKGALSQAEKRLLARKMTDCDTFPVTPTKEGHHANGRGHAAGVRAG